MLRLAILAALLGYGCGGTDHGDLRTRGGRAPAATAADLPSFLDATLIDIYGELHGHGQSASGLFLQIVGAGFGYWADVDATGRFAFRGVDARREFRLLLFDRDLALAAVLAQPAAKPGGVHQAFRVYADARLPLAVDGARMTLEELAGVELTSEITTLAPLGELPGLASVGLGLLGDADRDGLPDPFDPDRDGDGVIDAFQQSAGGPPRFAEGVIQTAALLSLEPELGGRPRFHLEIEADVRGARGAFEPLLVLPSSFTAGGEWQPKLEEVAAAGEILTYRRTHLLPMAASPRPRQIGLIVLETARRSRYVFPLALAPVPLRPIVAEVDAAVGVVRLVGAPFAGVESFSWQIEIDVAGGPSRRLPALTGATPSVALEPATAALVRDGHALRIVASSAAEEPLVLRVASPWTWSR